MLDAQLELRDIADGAETTTTTETAISLPVRYTKGFQIVAEVTALDTDDADETYSLDVLVADTAANVASSPAEVASTPIDATGRYEIAVTGDHIEARDADAAAVAIRATLGGTSPSITYGAWIEPL